MTVANRILLVDDDRTMIGLLSVLVHSQLSTLYDFEIRAFTDPEEALQSLGRATLIVTDVQMEPFSGIELIRRARERGIWTPVVVISGAPREEHTRELEEIHRERKGPSVYGEVIHKRDINAIIEAIDARLLPRGGKICQQK